MLLKKSNVFDIEANDAYVADSSGKRKSQGEIACKEESLHLDIQTIQVEDNENEDDISLDVEKDASGIGNVLGDDLGVPSIVEDDAIEVEENDDLNNYHDMGLDNFLDI